MRVTGIFAATAILALMATGVPAQAGLITTPPNTVHAFFFLGAHVPGDAEDEGTATIGPGGADFAIGVEDESSIHVGDTQIAITNKASNMPFCSTALPCADSFTGFEFQFSSGVDITGVSVDAASAADFLPNSTPPHMGLQLVSPTDVLVDVTGDVPAVDDQLVLDVVTGGAPPPPVPEPASLALLGVGLLGMCAVGMRPRRRHG